MQSGLFAGIVWERMVHQMNPILNKDKISIINVGLKRFEDNIWTAIIESNGITDMLNRIEYEIGRAHV